MISSWNNKTHTETMSILFFLMKIIVLLNKYFLLYYEQYEPYEEFD